MAAEYTLFLAYNGAAVDLLRAIANSDPVEAELNIDRRSVQLGRLVVRAWRIPEDMRTRYKEELRIPVTLAVLFRLPPREPDEAFVERILSGHWTIV